MNTFLLFATGIILGSFGGVLLKAGSKNILFSGTITKELLLSLLLNWKIFLGLICYFIPAIIWIFLLRKYPLSFVQPILALTYVITPILAILILKEGIPPARWLGIIIIIIGVFIISKTQ
ncbi:MAG TPA: hypothetical protein DEA43_00270 [Candidatus Moranbacteria bacterium]|nr:hypothetical protein [Candidatus Moranbacteria bacterium]HBT45306.1 hypothetical protein [Candidatus Moranbacteria bacterium]